MPAEATLDTTVLYSDWGGCPKRSPFRNSSFRRRPPCLISRQHGHPAFFNRRKLKLMLPQAKDLTPMLFAPEMKALLDKLKEPQHCFHINSAWASSSRAVCNILRNMLTTKSLVLTLWKIRAAANFFAADLLVYSTNRYAMQQWRVVCKMSANTSRKMTPLMNLNFVPSSWRAW